MSFRVLIAGGKHFTNYAALRAVLDKLLANRLPDVELLTTGGPGVPMLAASYATERGLAVAALVPDSGRYPNPSPVPSCRSAMSISAPARRCVLLTRRSGPDRPATDHAAPHRPIPIMPVQTQPDVTVVVAPYTGVALLRRALDALA